jgi:spermidine synthase
MKPQSLAPLETRIVVALIGFTAVVAQIVVLRESLVAFSGNEISVGIILGAWLIWTSAGSFVTGKLSLQGKRPRKLTGMLQVAVAIALPATILLIRFSRAVFQALPGEVLGPGVILASCFVSLSLVCFFSGSLFAAGSRLVAAAAGTGVSISTSTVYMLEAVGSGTGGLLASFFLVPFLSSFQIVFLLSYCNLCAATVLMIASKTLRIGAILMVSLLTGFLILSGAYRLDSITWTSWWKGFHLLEIRDSAYACLVVAEREGAVSLLSNGVPVANIPDPELAEEAVHFALLQHPRPARLLLVGGGLNGSLQEALRHNSITHLDYLELDPVLFEIARTQFRELWEQVRQDPRVELHPVDGRRFLKTHGESYDVIIVSAPEPQTASLNRFYTAEFFREVSQRLAAGGVFSFHVTGAENYISSELAAFLRCLNRTLATAFSEIKLMPGSRVHWFASNSRGVVTVDPQVLIGRLMKRGLTTEFVNEYYVPFRLMPDRVDELAELTAPEEDTPVNRDFSPVAYYFSLVLWTTQFGGMLQGLTEFLGRLSFFWVAVGLALTSLFLVVWQMFRRRQEKLRELSIVSCVAGMGFTVICLEILLLLGFQAFSGYVYRGLAILVAAFMAGMAFGSWQALTKADGVEGEGLRPLMKLQVAAAVAPVLICLLFLQLEVLRSGPVLTLVGAVLFPAAAAICGFLGGFQFPVASRVFFSEDPGVVNIGILYAADLLGACAGALLFSVFFLPLFGFLKSALLILMLNLGPIALTGAALWKGRRRAF